MLKFDWSNVSYEEITSTIMAKIEKRQKNLKLKSNICELVTEDGCKVYLVGTIHFSKQSIKDVQQIIQEVQPDAVVLEVCQYREQLLTLDEQSLLNGSKTFDTRTMLHSIKQFGLIHTLWSMLFLRISAYLIDELGMAPGGEFRKAFREAQKIPFCNVYLGDRSIFITFQRVAAALSFWDLVKAFVGFIYVKSSTVSVGKVIMKELKQKDRLEEEIQMTMKKVPEFYRVLVTERDAYLTQSLKQAAKPIVLPKILRSDTQTFIPSVVVGVVGIGHVAGIKKNWNKKFDTQELVRSPNPSLFTRVLQIAFVVTKYGLKMIFYYKTAQTLIWLFC
ncbi:traB domain-containing protein-like isoform X1 [Rhincodon typus]|uniref:traB domain-containing protein-like isoform X1 n=2 Tax=Rhincodon typus TaxID=259920 RepID=UPI00202E35B3|nr:traB domain-containing protein-like isoform X1 [Rhincodon typus]XP_048466450.1 traB domain-containing protein-like isoform X1 [Rhincodon typus]